MKNKDLIEFRKYLDEVDYIRGKVFAYAVFKNKHLIDQEIEAIKSTKNDPHPDYLNFENERTLLCQIHSEKDENDQPVLQYNPDGTQAFKIANIEDFNKEYQEMAEKYKDVLEDMQKSKADYDSLLEKESDIKLTKISIDDLPDDISASFLEKIKYMID
jgi:hypothetical protein